jgi:hypothetical protein
MASLNGGRSSLARSESDGGLLGPRRLMPRPEDDPRPDGWSVPRYSTRAHAFAETSSEVHHTGRYLLSDFRNQVEQVKTPTLGLDAEVEEQLEHPNGWTVPRYGGPQVARYVPDSYSSFVRPTRAPGVNRKSAPGEKWMQATGRRRQRDSTSTTTLAEDGNSKPDGWAVPRYSPLFDHLSSEHCRYAGMAEGSALSGVSRGAPPKQIPDEDAKSSGPAGKVSNPFLEMKKAAIRFEALRVAKAGDGVDVPAGWSVQRYAPKVAGLSANEMMKADPLGRPSCTSNLWWGMPKDLCAKAVSRGSGGATAAQAAGRECRRLPAVPAT